MEDVHGGGLGRGKMFCHVTMYANQAFSCMVQLRDKRGLSKAQWTIGYHRHRPAWGSSQALRLLRLGPKP